LPHLEIADVAKCTFARSPTAIGKDAAIPPPAVQSEDSQSCIAAIGIDAADLRREQLRRSKQ